MKSRELLNKLTIEEKIKMTTGNSMWTMVGNERLSIEDIIVADGPHGVRAYKEKPGFQVWGENVLAPSTLFPSAAAMASTFNEDLIYKVGETIGNECNHYNVDVLLAPGVNLKRSPLAGRNFEYYSEDPVLTSRMAINFIKGVQSKKVGTCVKHYALNEQEDQRRFVDTIASERVMHELYLKSFYNVIKEANPYTIMTSYNKVNGHYAGESPELLKDILRDKWNYKGCVISDWGGVQNKVKSIKNGMNIEMPGPSEFTEEIKDALHNNTLTETEIDNSLIPLLDLRDQVLKNDLKGTKADFNKGHDFAYLVSKESIVLLKNDGILPLKPNTKIAVIGESARTPRINGGGSATLKPFKLENPLEELKKEFTVEFAKGYNEEDTSKEYLQEVSKVVSNNEIILYFTGTTEKLETEGRDRSHMNLPKGHIEVMNEINKHNKKVIVILNNGGGLDLSPLDSANAILEAWFLGSSNGKALTEILVGITNPSGKLSETIPYCIEHTPHHKQFPSKQDTVYYQGDIIRLGYRYYDTHKYPVRYPFGHGLSYTTFVYSNLVLSSKELDDNSSITLTLDVTNTGSVKGKEVVQLYISDIDSFYPVPSKELKQFKKVEINPLETVTVSFTLSKKDFEIYSIDHHDYQVEAGDFDILICKNVNELLLKDTITYNNPTPFRTTLSLNHTLKTFSIYKKEVYDKLVKDYRDFPWFEIEEPALRVLKRVQKEFNIDDKTFNSILEELIQ